MCLGIVPTSVVLLVGVHVWDTRLLARSAILLVIRVLVRCARESLEVGWLRGQGAAEAGFWMWLRLLLGALLLGVIWHRTALALSACVLSVRHPVIC